MVVRIGRPPIPEHQRAVNTTRVVRLPKSVVSKLKTGYYDRVDRLIDDYRYFSQDASPTSPRYEKLREFISEYEEIVKSCKF